MASGATAHPEYAAALPSTLTYTEKPFELSGWDRRFLKNKNKKLFAMGARDIHTPVGPLPPGLKAGRNCLKKLPADFAVTFLLWALWVMQNTSAAGRAQHDQNSPGTSSILVLHYANVVLFYAMRTNSGQIGKIVLRVGNYPAATNCAVRALKWL